MFECMEIVESIYEVVLKPSYKKPTRVDTNRADHSRKMRGEAASSNSYSRINEIAGMRIKRYVNRLKDISSPNCLIHGPVYSSDECKVLGDLDSRYSKIMPTKDRRHDTVTKNKFNRHQ